jgi:formate hydrogenlyase subunit 3/multisubunit Na+/H+ antiporter MnhD subunit
MLVGILIVYFQCGSTDWSILTYFSPNRQLIYGCYFVSFAVKAPLVPFMDGFQKLTVMLLQRVV